MVLHPDAQRRAQMEIDEIVGTNRLPEFFDEPSLPYVSALFKEVMRWHPVAPMGTLLARFSAKQVTFLPDANISRAPSSGLG
jgi:cytochrome P450